MKRVIITIVIMVLATKAMAFDFLGPPSADLGKDRSGFGFEYLDSEITIDADGVFGLTDAEIEDIDFTKMYGVFRGSISPHSEIFVRFGIVDAQVDEGANEDNLGYYIGDSDSGLAIGGGAKFTFLETDIIKWGLVGQLSYVGLDFDGSEGVLFGLPASLEAEADILEYEIGIGPTIHITEEFCIYGGVLFNFIDGEADISGTLGALSGTETSNLKEDTSFGGFVGTKLEIAKTASIAVEFQTVGDSHAFGVSLLHLFSGPSRQEKSTSKWRSTPTLTTKPRKVEVDASGRKIKGYEVKRDESGEIIKDENGNFVFFPIYED